MAGLVCLAWIRGRGFTGPAAGGCVPSLNLRKGRAVTTAGTRAANTRHHRRRGHPRGRARRGCARPHRRAAGGPGVPRPPRPDTAGVMSGPGGSGTVALAGIEGSGSSGAGLARCITTAGVRVVEAGRSGRQDRRRQGKSGPLDAVSAARAARSGRARGAPGGRDGAVEAIRARMAARRSAAGERIQANGQARALILTGPGDLRARFTGHTAAALAAGLAPLRPRPGGRVGCATRIALREPGRRAEFPGGPARAPRRVHRPPRRCPRPPGLVSLYGTGPRTAALLLAAAGDHPERLRSEAARAHPCGAAPIPASPGKTVRRRHGPGGGRQASHAPVADRVHPPGPGSGGPRLRRTPHSRREIQQGNHPLPQPLHRPRGLSPPPHHRRLTRTPRGRPGP